MQSMKSALACALTIANDPKKKKKKKEDQNNPKIFWSA